MGYNTQLRLFKIERGNDTPLYFNSKRAAKAQRDKLRDEGEDAHVRRGPDHWKGETY